jgi:hypothetical protein
MRCAWVPLLLLLASCGNGDDPRPVSEGNVPTTAADAAHEGVTGPHGDHTPHHGGLVLMNGDVHYEVVLGADGRHAVWFSDAMRNELPASIVRGVRLEVARPAAPVETLDLAIDEAGEAWVAAGRPLAGDGILVKVRYTLDGNPLEIEIPYVAHGH